MMMLGRTLLGGALVAGYIALAGVASCSAAVSGSPQAAFKDAGKVTAAARLQAAVFRQAFSAGALRATGTVRAAPKVTFSLKGLSQSIATAYAKPHADFLAAGHVNALAQAKAQAANRKRMGQQPPAKAFAYGEGDVQTYFLAYGKTALARALLVGTTYHVGHGQATAYAYLQGDGQKTIGVTQVAVAQAYGSARAANLAKAYAKLGAKATGWGDAAVTKNNVRRFQLFARGEGDAYALVTGYSVFQPLMLTGEATATGSAHQQRGVKGKAVAKALATGSAELRHTGAQASPGNVTALAEARVLRTAQVYGIATASAQVQGTAKGHYNRVGKALANAQASLKTLYLRLAKQPVAAAKAVVAGTAVRRKIGVGHAQADAVATGYNQINDLAWAPSSRTVVVTEAERLRSVAVEARTITV